MIIRKSERKIKRSNRRKSQLGGEMQKKIANRVNSACQECSLSNAPRRMCHVFYAYYMILSSNMRWGSHIWHTPFGSDFRLAVYVWLEFDCLCHCLCGVHACKFNLFRDQHDMSHQHHDNSIVLHICERAFNANFDIICKRFHAHTVT